MKNNHIILSLLFAASVLAFTGCENFLNQPAYDDFTDAEYWQNEDQARTYMYGFYTSVFSGYGTGTSHGPFLMGQTTNDDFASDKQQLNLRPEAVPVSDGSWSFSNIRKANYVLENIDRIDANVATKNHWRGVARFFRACYYSNLTFTYGDVPWFDRVPVASSKKDDLDYLYKDRDPRTYVDARIIEDFRYAMDSVRENDGALQINRYVVAAMASRYLLREGTFLKYHNIDLDMAEECLVVARDAALLVMNSGKYSIAPSYKSLFVSDDLADNPEIIMYRHYEDGVLAHSTLTYSFTEAQAGLSKSLAEAFLTADGLPLEYKYPTYIPKTEEEFFNNRDPRLTMCIRPHYYLKGTDTKPFNYALSGYSWCKFMDDDRATTPEATWTGSKNITDAPCLRYAEVLLNYAEAAYELHLLNASYPFSNAELDRSINLIRARKDVNLPALQVIAGNQPAVNGIAYVDPKYTAIEYNAQYYPGDRTKDGGPIDAILWEIRRERRVELCMEGFRLNDLKRWYRLGYLYNGCNPDIRYGAYINKDNYQGTDPEIVLVSADVNDMATATADAALKEGYILRNTEGMREMPVARNYVNPVPSGQITLYKTKGYTLTQTKEWQ